MTMQVYLLDANVFIEAKNGYYGFDIAPSFWNWLDDMHDMGCIFSVRPVIEELEEGHDQLADWAKDRKADWGLRVDGEDTQRIYVRIVNWVMANDQFHLAGREAFLDGADPWLIAHAQHMEATVVTHEPYEPHVRRKVPIPNVCREFGVPYMNTFELMRTLGASI